MSDTPRTEAEVNRQKCCSDDLITIDANFACQLERELNAANAKIKRLKKAGNRLLTVMRGEKGAAYCEWLGLAHHAEQNWIKAKEAKP